MLFVEELSRRASQGSVGQRSVLWFLFWPLLLAWSFVRRFDERDGGNTEAVS